MTKQERDTQAAFKWIVGILRAHDIPFMVSGGLAARAYGATRELADIDIVMPDSRFGEIVPEVKNYITFGPANHVSEDFDVFLLTLNYKGQDIDLSGSETERQYHKEAKKWVDVEVDLTEVTEKEIYGLRVPVTYKEELIAYKRRLGNEWDLEDIRQIEEVSQ